MSDLCDECGRELTVSKGRTIAYELGIGTVCPPCRTEVMESTKCTRCGNRDPIAAEWGICTDCFSEEEMRR